MEFVAIDVETSNPRFHSICQIGIASFLRLPPKVWTTYVNPEEYFCPTHVAVHGITEEQVRHADKFPRVYEKISQILQGKVVVSHTAFDRSALRQVCDKYGLPEIGCRWLDSARVTRKAWPQFAQRGYGLGNITSHLGIEFKHHDAGEDARAAGMVLLKAIEETGIDLDGWFAHLKRPPDVRRDGHLGGPLSGEVIVFTGALSVPRRQAANIADAAGGAVGQSVTRKTTMLVVGSQDLERLAGHKKSAKHRKAEDLILKGQPIRILGEDDFVDLIEDSLRDMGLRVEDVLILHSS